MKATGEGGREAERVSREEGRKEEEGERQNGSGSTRKH